MKKMKKQNIFERAAVVANGITPFFLQEQKKSAPMSFCACDSEVLAVATYVKRIVAYQLTTNKKFTKIKHAINALKDKKKNSPKDAISVYDVYRAYAGKPNAITYYEAESIALASDAEYVAAVHNYYVACEEMRALFRETVKQVLRQTAAFANLPPVSRKEVLRTLNLPVPVTDPHEEKRNPLPLTPAAKYSIRVRLCAPEEPAKPDPEIVEYFTEIQEMWEANGNGKRGNAGGWKQRALAAEMLKAGMKVTKLYATSDKKRKGGGAA